jgi:hypothetical protein
MLGRNNLGQVPEGVVPAKFYKTVKEPKEVHRLWLDAADCVVPLDDVGQDVINLKWNVRLSKPIKKGRIFLHSWILHSQNNGVAAIFSFYTPSFIDPSSFKSQSLAQYGEFIRPISITTNTQTSSCDDFFGENGQFGIQISNVPSHFPFEVNITGRQQAVTGTRTRLNIVRLLLAIVEDEE